MVNSPAPWLHCELVIHADVLRETDAHGIEAYPNESCGMLTGPMSDAPRIDRCVRQVNHADRYHAADPAAFPRTARTFYVIDPRVAYRSFEQGERDGQPIKAIYHSHCDVGAYFSEEDRAAAAPDGVLSYPVVFVVTSVRDGAVDDRKVFAFRSGSWVEVPYRVVE